MIMKKNLNNTDKTVRTLLAILLAALYITRIVSGIPGIILMVIATFLLITAFVRFCPVYHLLGISTKKTAPPEKE